MKVSGSKNELITCLLENINESNENNNEPYESSPDNGETNNAENFHSNESVNNSVANREEKDNTEQENNQGEENNQEQESNQEQQDNQEEPQWISALRSLPQLRINEEEIQNYDPVPDNKIDSLVELNYTITNQCEKDYQQDEKQIERVNGMSQETMYTYVMGDGNDWILSLLLTVKKVTLHFIRENHPTHHLEDVAYQFRQYINNELQGTPLKVLRCCYQRYLMAKECTFELPAYDDSKLQSILQDFDLVNYIDESYFSYHGDLYIVNDYIL